MSKVHDKAVDLWSRATLDNPIQVLYCCHFLIEMAIERICRQVQHLYTMCIYAFGLCTLNRIGRKFFRHHVYIYIQGLSVAYLIPLPTIHMFITKGGRAESATTSPTVWTTVKLK